MTPGRDAAQRAAPFAMRILLAIGCLLTVALLLAWAEGLGTFRTWFVACTVPALAAVTITLVCWWRAGRYPDTVLAARAGVIGGVLGTLAGGVVRTVVERQGTMAHVRADNGWEGWVAHDLLLPGP